MQGAGSRPSVLAFVGDPESDLQVLVKVLVKVLILPMMSSDKLELYE
jgi:hypothetical protein